MSTDVRVPPTCGCRWEWIDADGFCACCQAHLDDPDGLYALQGDGSHAFKRCPERLDEERERP